MAGLNFSTTTIVNSLAPKATEVAAKGILRVGKGVDLVGKKITAVYKTAGHEPSMCKAVIDLAGLSGNYRLDVKLGTDGAVPLIFAAPYAQNGTPFWVGLNLTGTNDIAAIAKDINDRKLFVMGDVLLVARVATANDKIGETAQTGKLILEAVSEHVRFRDIKLVKFTDFDASTGALEKTEVVEGKVVIMDKGVNGFGTYSHIIKDLRLPTGANLAFNHLREDETPAPGVLYTQYVIEYEAPSSIRGTQVVGSINTSHTQHIAWVASSNVTAFDGLLSTAGVASNKIDTVTVNLTQKKSGSDLLDPEKNETGALDD